MRIQANESEITGNWITVGGKVTEDDVCLRIHQLVSGHLKLLGHGNGGWDALYYDPADGRLWELLYPQSELAGGGPPKLVVISRDSAEKKYGDIAQLVKF